jgi:hypothetical protein
MAAPIPGNAKSIMTQDQQAWNDLICPGKDTIPNSIAEIDQWIQTIARCMSANPKSTDQIDRDLFSNQHIISDSFGILARGQLMNALGDNNDCLIHSFLTCVSPFFRKLEDPIRSSIAGYFRRFILASIEGIDQTVRKRLQSYHFLTGGEIEFLSKKFQIPIINLQDGDGEIDRTMEIFPTSKDSFWNGKNDTYTGPFYLIHGDNVHFTPIAYNGVYSMILNYGDVKSVADTITSEHAAVFEAASEDNAKLDVVKQDFKDRIQPIMDSIKKDIEDTKNNNQKKKSIKMTSMLEILTPITEEYIKDIIQQKLIREELLEKARVVIRTTLLEELSKRISPTTPNSSSDKIKKLEAFADQYGLNNDDALSQAIKASLNESVKINTVNTSVSVTPTPTSTTSGNQKVLRSISNITAKIGNVSTQYSATVYKPVSNAIATVVNGGKRNTKKSKRVKNKKTKKTNRSK